MKYRKFGQLDWQVSALGFGAMRLPTSGTDKSQIDEDQAIAMIRYAIDHGVNYIDSAYVYHGGNSEIVVGKALRDGYRDRVRVATKLWMQSLNTPADMDRMVETQAERLGSGKIDFYLLHGMRAAQWPKIRDLKIFEWAERLKADGRIGHFGFSFHDTLDVFKGVIDGYSGWDFCQIQYNYTDTEYQAGTEGLRYAADKGLAVVVMEPLRGGNLSKLPPQEVQAIWDASPVKRTRADWALQWVWNQPEVSTVLSGMSSMQHVVENCESADKSGPGTLTSAELDTVDRVREVFRARRGIDCTACAYCMPCPAGVNIPANFQAYNSVKMMDDRKDWIRVGTAVPSLCADCGQCEQVCPQHLPIRDTLKVVSSMFEQPK